MTKSSGHKPIKTAIYYKIFPMKNIHWKNFKILNDNETIYIRYLRELRKGVSVGQVPKYWKFKTNEVFYNNPMNDIYLKIGPGVLESCGLGKSVIIIAFGQTGSGKSSTITGLRYSFQDRGFIPRLIEDIFKIPSTLPNDIKMTIKVSYIEFNKTKATDLLKADPTSFNNLSVQNIKPIKVRNEDEALKYLYLGEGRKEFSESSHYLSHNASSIFTFYLTKKNTGINLSESLTTKVHIVDLAGIDNPGNISCSFKKPQEISIGNVAKSDLEQFLLILSNNNSKCVQPKYRLNTMIHYLSDSLKNECILSFIGHLRITDQDLPITLSLLRFGQLVKDLKITKNGPLSEKTQKEKQKYKNMLKEYNIIFRQPKTLKSTENCRRQMEQLSKDYIEDQITENELINIADIDIILKTLKSTCLDLKTELENISKTIYDQAYADAYIALTKMKKSAISSSVVSLAGSRVQESIVIPEISKKNIKEKFQKKSLVKINKDKSDATKVGSISKSNENLSSLLGHHKSSQRSVISDLVLISELTPEYYPAWKAFVEDKDTRYIETLDNYKFNEKEAKIAYKFYLNGVSKLRKSLDLFEKKKNDLLQIQINKKLLDVKDVDETILTNVCNAEKCFKDNLKELETRIAKEQEQLLKYRTELNIYLKICKNIKSEIKNNFDRYCLKNFNMPLVPDTLVSSNEINERVISLSNTSSNEISNNNKMKTHQQSNYNKLKKLLINEENKKINIKKNWITY